MPRLNSHQGQSLVEWAVLAPLYLSLFIGFLGFTEWFMVKQRLLMAVRNGAFLYSSGRLNTVEVKELIRRSLQQGVPSLSVFDSDITVGRAAEAKSFQLDRITVTYHPHASLLRFVQQSMEESCVIKHAPPYWGFYMIKLGPPVAW